MIAGSITTSLFLIFLVRVSTLELEDVLLEDLIPNKGSVQCDGKGKFTTSFSFDFQPSPVEQWSKVNAPHENLAFLARMSHVDDENGNRTWTASFGHGGNIYSLVGAYGEAIPPQTRADSPWVDEVTQSVAVDTHQMDIPNGKLYYIHQAGTYVKDHLFMPPPFYSPNLAKSCHDNTCRFASWGQQAHVPTTFRSSVIYIHQYRNCGNGVLEYSQMIMNIGSHESLDNNLNYINVPWAGVRTSNFQHMRLSSQQGTMLPPQIPLQRFGREDHHYNLADTGGFTTFVHDIPVEPPRERLVDLPCVIRNTNQWRMSCTEHNIKVDKYSRLELIVQANNTCQYLPQSSANQGGYVVQMKTHNPRVFKSPNMYGCRKCRDNNEDGLKIINQRTGQWVWVPEIIWWSRSGYTFFEIDNTTTTESDINRMFLAGDKIQVAYVNNIKKHQNSEDNQLALSYVHGIDEEYDDAGNREWMPFPTRLRYGLAGRDFTVFTVNSGALIPPGRTYLNRQFIISDELSKIEKNANSWVDETFSDVYHYVDFQGRILAVYANETERKFGVVPVDGNTTICNNTSLGESLLPKCIGSTTPKSHLKPFFYIQCGNSTYFGPDLYHFSTGTKEELLNHLPQMNTTKDTTKPPIRSYVCNGESNKEIRPIWKLMGHFNINDKGCHTLIMNYTYDNKFCFPVDDTESSVPFSPTNPPISSQKSRRKNPNQ